MTEVSRPIEDTERTQAELDMLYAETRAKAGEPWASAMLPVLAMLDGAIAEVRQLALRAERRR